MICLICIYVLWLEAYTVNGERFAELNICGMKFSWEYFCIALASSVYCLAIAKYSQENVCSTLKNSPVNLSLFKVYQANYSCLCVSQLLQKT